MKDSLYNVRSETELAQIYFKINPIRNSIAHASFDRKRASLKKDVKEAKSDCTKVRRIFKSKILEK